MDERTERLLKFVQDEVRNMRIDNRLAFLAALMNFCRPELEQLAKVAAGADGTDR